MSVAKTRSMPYLTSLEVTGWPFSHLTSFRWYVHWVKSALWSPLAVARSGSMFTLFAPGIEEYPIRVRVNRRCMFQHQP